MSFLPTQVPPVGQLMVATGSQVLSGRQLLIFDFDGTVADTTPLHAQAFGEVLAPWGLSVHYPDIAGLRTQDAIALCLMKAGFQPADTLVAELKRQKQERVRALISSSIRPMSGVVGFLNCARGRYRLALATSGSRSTVMLALEGLGLTGYFQPMVFGEDVARAKPAPDVFLAVLQCTGVPHSQALVFEDAPAGLAAARVAGIDHVDVRQIHWEDWTAEAA